MTWIKKKEHFKKLDFHNTQVINALILISKCGPRRI
jgi:hypothetical protein